jgi:hypothetical protein
MKKFILVGLALVLLISCQEKQPVRFKTSSSEIDEIKALIKDYEDGNWTNWVTHYADSAKIFVNTLEGVSREQMNKYLTETISNLSSYGFSHEDEEIFYENIIDDKGNNWVYFWGTWEVTVSGTNKELAVPIHIAFKMVENKIVTEYAYFDPSGVTNAIIEKQVAEEDVVEIIE